MITAEHEQIRQGGEGFADAVTFAFGDPASGVFGLARLGATTDGTSGLALLFSGREPVAALARQSVEESELAATIEAPLERWQVRFAADEASGFELEFTAVGPPAELSAQLRDAGGMDGYEQLCRVAGSVRVHGNSRPVDCLGQRGHQWGTPDWERLSLARTVTAWLDDGRGVALASVRAKDADGHDAERTWAAILGPEGAAPIADPRMSTTYDTEGRQRRAGLELWPEDEDSWATRGAGEVLCGSTLELGRLRLDCAFFEWHVDGRPGVGRYDILRSA